MNFAMEADPKVVLEWLGAKNGELRALQLTALEQLCNEVLFSDNVDVFCDRYPPRCFLPALCRIFLDDQAPSDVLEANARAISYYVDMHLDWCRYVTQSAEVLRAISSHLECVDMTSSKSNEFGQQLIKLMKILCNYDPGAIYSNGGLTAVVQFVRESLPLLHTDVLQAGMELIQKLFNKADPSDGNLKLWIESLSALLDYRESGVADQTLRAFANLVARFAHLGADPSPLAHPHIIACLLYHLRVAGGVEKNVQMSDSGASGTGDAGASLDTTDTQTVRENITTSVESNPALVQAVTNILITLCCSSSSLTQALLTSDGQFATTLAMVLQRSEDETVILSVLRLVNILLILLYQNSDAPFSSKLQSAVESGTKHSPKSLSTPAHTNSSSAVRINPPSTTAIPTSEAVIQERNSANQQSKMTSTTMESGSPIDSVNPVSPESPKQSSDDRDSLHRSVIEAIKQQDFDFVKRQVESNSIDVNYTDHLGQTLLNWAASFGTPAMVDFLCSHGANIHQGVRSSLDYAATFGRVEVCRMLLARGADPNQRDSQGLRPIDRARGQGMHPGCHQVVELLEMEARRSSNRTTVKPLKSLTVDVSTQDSQGSSIKSDVEAQRIFVHQLFPTLVGLFRDSVSLIVKRQCLLLVRRMAVSIHPDHLKDISLLDCQNLPFAFLLTELIYGVLIEETDEFVLRALSLSHCLLLKAPQIYLTVFHRLGLVPMIRQLSDIWSHLVPIETEVPDTEPNGEFDTILETPESTDPTTTNEQQTVAQELDSAVVSHIPIRAEQLNINQLYCWRGWNLIWVRDLLSMFTPNAFVIVLLHPCDGALRALAVHSGGDQQRVPVMLSPDESAVSRPGLKSQMLRLHQHLMDASNHLDKKPLWPDAEKRDENVAEDNQPQSEGTNSSHPRFSARLSRGKFETSKANWRRIGMHLGLRRPPEPTQLSKNPNMRWNPQKILQRQASSPARTCIPFGQVPLGTRDRPTALGKPTNVVTIGPLVCSLRETGRGSWLCIQARSLQDMTGRENQTDASFKEALLLFEEPEQGFSRVCVSSVYPEGSVTKVSEVNQQLEQLTPPDEKEKQVTLCSSSTGETSLRRRHSVSFLNRISKLNCELQSDEEKSTESSEYDGEAPELFDFDALFGVGTDYVSDQSYGPANDEAVSPRVTEKSIQEVNSELRRINEILFPCELVHETYNSGHIPNWLCIDEDCIVTENKDRRERAFKQLNDIRKQALKLSTDLLNVLTNSGTAIDSTGCTFHDELCIARKIATDIWMTYQSDQNGESTRTLNALSAVFQRLADLLRSGEQAITAYELTTSGIVPALLLCLSTAHAGKWHCPIHVVGPDVTTRLLWYLRERRRVFLQHMCPQTGPSPLGCLSRRIVHAFELSEHLPLRLFALSHCFNSRGQDRNPCETSQTTVSQTDIQSTQSTVESADELHSSRTTHLNLASFPLGLIRAAQEVDSMGESESKGLGEIQQFADCLDSTELSAVLTLTPHLAYHTDGEYVVPGMHQIDARIVMDLHKLDDVGQRDEHAPTELKDLSGQTIQANPLVTVAQLENVLLQTSAKQWYHKPRTELSYWKQVAHANKTGRIGVTFSAPMTGIGSIDTVGGVIDWLATNGNTLPLEQWVNPALIGLVTVAASVGNLVMGNAASVLGPRSGTLIGGYPVRCSGVGAITRPTRVHDWGASYARTNCGKNKMGTQAGKSNGTDEIQAWFAVDLGLQLVPTAYSMAYLREAEDFSAHVAPRNWNLEASNDGVHWTVLRKHVNDTSIQSLSGSRAAWDLLGCSTDTSDGSCNIGYRFFKIQSTGVNANGENQLAVGGLEFYGTVCSTHESVYTSGYLAQLINRESFQRDCFRDMTQVTDPSSEADDLRSASLTHQNSTPEDDWAIQDAPSSDFGEQSMPTAYSGTAVEVSDSSSLLPPPLTSSVHQTLERHISHADNNVQPADDCEFKEQSDNNFLQCLSGFLSCDESSEAIRRFLRHIQTQESVDDDSLHHFPWSTNSNQVAPSTFGNVVNFEQQGRSSLSERLEERFKTEDSSANLSSKHVSANEGEIQDDKRTNERTAMCVEDSSDATSGIRKKLERPCDVFTFIDLSTWSDASESQTTHIHEPLDLNPEDAEAREFADTVEAIIEHNISSNDTPFYRHLPSTIPDRFSRVVAQSDLDKLGIFGTTGNLKSQTSLQCGLKRKREQSSVEQVFEEALQDIGSEPEYTTGSETLHNILKPEDSETSGDKVSTTTNCKERSDGQELIAQSIQYTFSLDRQNNSPPIVTVASKPPRMPNSEGTYKIPTLPTSKGNRQMRRRLRRSRPKGAALFSNSTLQPQNRPYEPSSPLSWNEATDYLRLAPGLIPVFDPNPGCTNAPATTPFVLCNPPSQDKRGDSHPSSGQNKPRIALFLSVFEESSCVAQVAMQNADATLFKYVQELCQVYKTVKSAHSKPAHSDENGVEVSSGTAKSQTEESPHHNPVLKLGYRLWYASDKSEADVRRNQAHCLLTPGDLRLTPAMQCPIEYTKSGIKITMLNEIVDCDRDASSFINTEANRSTSPEQLLELLMILYQLSGLANHSVSTTSFEASDGDSNEAQTTISVTQSQAASASKIAVTYGPRILSKTKSTVISSYSHIRTEDFVSSRLTRKLMRQIRDPLAMSSGALPDWCFTLTRHLTALFSFETRLDLLRAHAFGPARSVIWLQNQPPMKSTGVTSSPLSRSHSDGSSTCSGTHRTRRNAVTAAHTLVLSSLTGQRAFSHVLSPSTTSEVLHLRPSILSHLTTSSANTNGSPILDQPAHLDSPVLSSLFSSLGLTLPPGFSLRSDCSRDLSELWNCLLSRTIRNHNAMPNENRMTVHIARLHKEFARLPRMPRELCGTDEQLREKGTDDHSDEITASTFWDWAACLMNEHASRKSELEIQFIGEDGTGLGPTLEFYSLLAAELRRRDGLMWITNDLPVGSDDLIESTRPALPTVASKSTFVSSSQSRLNQTVSDKDNFDLTVEAHAYVNTPHGLFPAPWPQDRIPESVLHRFYILGITVAKCLQDNRRIDLPFSPPLLKLLSSYGRISHSANNCALHAPGASAESIPQEVFNSIAQAENVFTSINVPKVIDSSTVHPVTEVRDAGSECDLGKFLLSTQYRRLHGVVSSSRSSHWLSNVLSLEDFQLIYPERAQFFQQAVEFCRRKYNLAPQSKESNEPETTVLEALAVELFGCSVEDMSLSLEYSPTAQILAGTMIHLCDSYEWEDSVYEKLPHSSKFDLAEDADASNQQDTSLFSCDAESVTVHNIDQYVVRTLDYCLDKGIRKQMDAFRSGFERVLPLDWLALFSWDELGQLIAGDSVAQWSRDDLLTYTVPCFGFTHQSPTYQMLINVLCEFNALERRAFLQFTTGCSSLPPGGLRNLHPRLRVVRKDAGTGALPSVNTCVHYLKLPEYQTEAELRSMLLRATREIGFYLN